MATIKIKFRGKWIDAGGLETARESARAAEAPAPPLDVATLPDAKDLDLSDPIGSLGDRCPAVRKYITAKGEMRGGLDLASQAIAEEILRLYGRKEDVKT